MSIVREDDGYMIKASSLSARFKDKADSTDMISITDGKHSVSWGVESDDAPEAKIIENKPDNDMIRAPLSWITSDIGYEGLDVITYDEISTLVSIRDITSDSDTVWHVLTNIRGDIESIYDHNDGFHTRYSYH
ncbi:MAG: hypothetical protein J6P61_00205 [Erysipelotrichaceae bacterium]|nr:hypothetical protein [Erysipelotrichaceae bacterium]